MNGSSKLYTSADGRTFVEVLKDPNKKGSRMTGQSFSLLKKVRLACTQRMRYRIDLPIVLSCMVSFAASHPEFLDWAVSKGVPQARTETL